ncbi:MAG TPA: hypothetical protein VEF53_18955 [Patescibacteria group bacterium]|nr:hypothetical protein [Patescibacteria group bacterium]
MDIKKVYDQVLTEIPSIEMRSFINRFNQAVNDLSMRYPLSMPIIETEIDTSYDYTLFTCDDFDNADFTCNELDNLDNTCDEFDEGEGLYTVTAKTRGIFPYIYPLPEDCASVFRVYRKCPEYKYEVRDYTVDTAGIQFPCEGIFEIHYYKKNEIQSLKDTVIIPWQFFNAIVYFIVGNELMDTNEKKAVLNMQRYEDSAKNASKNLKSQKSRNMRIKQQVWR